MSEDNKHEPKRYPMQFWIELGMWELDIEKKTRGRDIDEQLADLFRKWQEKQP